MHIIWKYFDTILLVFIFTHCSFIQHFCSIFGNNVALSINAYEFARADNTVCSYDEPGKFWVGINLQKLTIPSKAFFTGVSTQNSPITAIINTNTATTQTINAMLIAVYDAIIDIDTQTKQVVIVS